MTELTWRQEKILQVIRDTVQRRGYPPTLREIGDAVGLASTDSVRFQLDNLMDAGYLTRVFHRPRSIRLADPLAPPGENVFGYSAVHLGLVTAHVPSLRAATGVSPDSGGREVADVWPMPRQVVGDGDLFVVEVTDDSMQGVAIARGASVVVRREPHVWDGLVAVEVGGEAVVRTLDGEWLVAHHPEYMPTQLNAGVSVLGLVVAVIQAIP